MCPFGPEKNEINKKHMIKDEVNIVKDGRKKSNWNSIPLLSLHRIFKYLTTKDRLSASSTCRSWRSMLFHREIWPTKNLKVNLCSYKFTVPESRSKNNESQAIAQQYQSNQFNKSGFHTFQVNKYSTNNNTYQQQWSSYCDRNRSKHHNRLLKRMLRSCDKFLQELTIFFDPNSANNVIDLIQIFRHLSQNNFSPFYSFDFRSNYCELKSLKIVPINPLVRTVNSEGFVQLYHELTDVLRQLFSKCQNFETISLGNLHEISSSIDDIFEELFFKESNTKKIKNLDVCTIKGDPYSYIENRSKLTFLSELKRLQILSLDFDHLTSELVEQMCELTFLQSFTVNVHRFSYDHSGIKLESSRKLSQFCPKLRLTVNLFHIDSVHLGIIKESLFNSDLSLKNLRVYFLNLREIQWQLFYNMLDIVSRRHSKTIETLILVDHIHRPKRFFKYSNVNALVMLSWMCRQLHYLTIIGYELSSVDIIAIARLRGASLRNLYLPSSCIDFQLEQLPQYLNYRRRRFEGEISRYFNDCISIALKRAWSPIDWELIPEMIHHSHHSSLLTYHRTMIEQNIIL